MNSPSLRYVMLKLYFPAAFLVAIILLILDGTAPPVVAQVRTVTVTVYATIVQQVYITLERTVMVTVATGVPTTLTRTLISVVSSLLTKTVSVAAPIQVGPLSLDLTNAGGLRFLGYTAGVAMAGLIGGGLVTRALMRGRNGVLTSQEPGPTGEKKIIGDEHIDVMFNPQPEPPGRPLDRGLLKRFRKLLRK